MVGFIKSAMKAIRTPGLQENLGDFHRALILHLMYMDAKAADGLLTDEFDITFHEATRKYLDFLKSLGLELDKSTITVTFDKDCDFSKARKP